MPNDILQRIHKANEHNLAAAGCEDGPPGPGSRSSDTLLAEIQQRIAAQIRGRVDRAVARFGEHLASLAQENAALSVLEDPLLKTQEIGYQGPSSEDVLEAIRSLERRFDKVDARLRAYASPDALSESVRRDLEQLHDTLVENLFSGSASRDSESLDGDLERLHELRALKESLAELSERLREAPDIGVVMEKLESWEECYEVYEESDDESPADAGGSSDENTVNLLERFADLEATLTGSWESVAERLGASTANPLPELPKLLEEIRVLMETNLASSGDAQGQGGPEHADLGEQIQGLRKDFSLLVHTINSHLEDSQDLTNRVATTVRDTLQSVSAGGGSAELAERLESALTELEKLKALPEKIGAILSVADEVNHFSVTSALQEAVEGITSRMEELMAK